MKSPYRRGRREKRCKKTYHYYVPCLKTPFALKNDYEILVAWKWQKKIEVLEKKLSQSRYFHHTYWHGKINLNETDLVDVIYSRVLRQLKRMDFLNHTKRCQIYFWQSSFPRKWQLNLYSSGMWHRVVWYIHINVYSEPVSSILITR